MLLSHLSEYPCEYENLKFAEKIAGNDANGQVKFDTLRMVAKYFMILANRFYKLYKCLSMHANAVANLTNVSDFDLFGRRLHGLKRTCISGSHNFNVALPFKF